MEASGERQNATSETRTKTTEVEARMALVCASTDDGRPLTSGTNLIWTVVEWFTSGSISNCDERQNYSS